MPVDTEELVTRLRNARTIVVLAHRAQVTVPLSIAFPGLYAIGGRNQVERSIVVCGARRYRRLAEPRVIEDRVYAAWD